MVARESRAAVGAGRPPAWLGRSGGNKDMKGGGLARQAGSGSDLAGTAGS